jgi:hypothetical protein
MGLDVQAAAEPGGGDLGAGVQEPAVLPAVAAARQAYSGRWQRAVLGFQLG